MDITLLIQFFVLLVLVLAVLIFILLRIVKARKKRLQKRKKTKKKTPPDLKILRDRLKDKNLSSTHLQETMNLIIKEYGVIKDFAMYADIILRMTRHPSANKEIVLEFERELSRLNPHYALSISHSITNGLSSR